MSDLRSHRDLVAWQRAMDLVVFVYKATARWPKEDLYGLTTQARRANPPPPDAYPIAHCPTPIAYCPI